MLIYKVQVQFSKDFLKIEKSKKKHRKPQHLMLKLKEDKVDPKKIDELVVKIDALVKYKNDVKH